MRKELREAGECFLLVAIGAAIVAGIGSIGSRGAAFPRLFVIMASYLTTIGVTAGLTVVGIASLVSRRFGQSEAASVFAWVMALLITCPTALWLVSIELRNLGLR